MVAHKRRNRKGISIAKRSHVIYGNSVVSTLLLEVFLSGAGTVLRFERDAWSMVR